MNIMFVNRNHHFIMIKSPYGRFLLMIQVKIGHYVFSICNLKFYVGNNKKRTYPLVIGWDLFN